MLLHGRLACVIQVSAPCQCRSAPRIAASFPPSKPATPAGLSVIGSSRRRGAGTTMFKIAAGLTDPAAPAAAAVAPSTAHAQGHGAAATTAAGQAAAWVSLGVGSRELRLEFTLPTGQSFRWRQTGEGRYTGVIGTRVVEMQQMPDDVLYRVLVRGQPSSTSAADTTAPHTDTNSVANSLGQEDDAAIRGYFNLTRCGHLAAVTASCGVNGSNSDAAGSAAAAAATGSVSVTVTGAAPGAACTLAQLADQWSACDPRFAAISPYFPGARMLRQDPVECLFQFICSSNNHISRIHGMVERLCSAYGTPLPVPQHLSHCESPWDAAAFGTGLKEGKTKAGVKEEATADAKGEEMSAGSSGTVVGGLVAGGEGSEDSRAEGGCSPARSGQGQGCGKGEAAGGGLASPQALAGAGTHAAAALATPGTPVQASRRRRRTTAAANGGSGAGGKVDKTASMASDARAAGGAVSGPAGLSFYAFPTLEQLSAATEQELRDAGFGYRAKFIVGSVALLLAKEGGGHAWLLGLRQQSYKSAVEQLCTLPGIGPKVAACVSLFSLDKHEAIPVDTHVWQVATRYYLPHLKGKALTKKVHEDVQRAFEERFGPFAGWAHNTLFISELASQRERLPEELRPSSAAAGKKRKARQASTSSSSEDERGA